ncbi:MAG: low molecular weight protein-tyrosine-phosphatase [Cyclobacteriaceae bacterium]
MKNILFVCLGNICRSPLAEAIFNHQIKQRNLADKFSSDSAGTSNYHIGENPDTRSIASAVSHGVEISHKGRQFHYLDGKKFDYILAMDKNNYRDIIHEMGNKHEGLYLMRQFDDKNKGADVPDPYYGGEDGFENVFQILSLSINNFIDFLVKKEN